MPTEIQPFTPSISLAPKATALPSVSPQTSRSMIPSSTSSMATTSDTAVTDTHIATTTPSSIIVESYIPSVQPIIGKPTTLPSASVPTARPLVPETLHPNDKLWKTPQPSPYPSLASETALMMKTDQPTQIPLVETAKSTELKVLDFPKLNYVLLITQGDLSDKAVEGVESAVHDFLSAELASYYKDSFTTLSLGASDIQSVVRDVDLKKTKIVENLIRYRKLSKVVGTQVTFEGEVGFNEAAPSEVGLTDALLFIGEEYNKYLVSNITSAGQFELRDVIFVLVESSSKGSTPSSSPNAWKEELTRTPDSLVEPVEAVPQGARTSVIIVSICGVAALSMLFFVFATRSRPSVDDKHDEEVVHVQNSPQSSSHILPVEIDVESAQASFGKSCHNENESGFDLNDNEVSTIISSVTDWNDYPTVDSKRTNRTRETSDAADSFNLGAHVEVVGGSRSHEDVVATWYTPYDARKSLQSAAELNSIGTRTLERNNESVVPKTWAAASSQRDVARFSLGATSVSTARREESDSDDLSTENRFNDGGFPVRRSLDGSFPSAKYHDVDLRALKTCGDKIDAETIYNDLDSSVDYSATSSPYDWSHIGTVDDVLDDNSESKAAAKHEILDSVPGVSNCH
eukprot:CCRYP_006619-RB/>CCRYP_006619-RB protein AED:0.21 eAED:0.21 QI:759/1/1/1/1/1/5/683/629